MPVVYETEAPLAPRSSLGPHREADYLALPDEPRCELLYGRLLAMPTPTLRHQHVVGRIVDPGPGTFEFLENAAEGFRLRLSDGPTYRSAAIAGLELDLEAFWRAIPS